MDDPCLLLRAPFEGRGALRGGEAASGPAASGSALFSGGSGSDGEGDRATPSGYFSISSVLGSPANGSSPPGISAGGSVGPRRSSRLRGGGTLPPGSAGKRRLRDEPPAFASPPHKASRESVGDAAARAAPGERTPESAIKRIRQAASAAAFELLTPLGAPRRLPCDGCYSARMRPPVHS